MISKEFTIKTDEQKAIAKPCIERKCRFLAKDFTCDFIGHTGRSRVKEGIPSGAGCTVWEPRGEETKRHPLSEVHKPRPKREVVYAQRFTQMDRLYRQGMNDRQIAAEVGCSHQAVGLWRRRNGLEMNYRRKKAEA